MQNPNTVHENSENVYLNLDPKKAIELLIEENDAKKSEWMYATELEKLKNELAQAHSELGVLKTDIENFKSWTKKLDWSTTEQPSWLEKFFNLEQKQGVAGTFADGTPKLTSGQMVDGVFHGPSEWINSTKGTVVQVHQVNGNPHGVLETTNKSVEEPSNTSHIVWMGKNLNRTIRTYQDGSVAHHCADPEDNGVSIGVKI